MWNPVSSSTTSSTTTTSTSSQSSERDTNPQRPEDVRIETVAERIIPHHILMIAAMALSQDTILLSPLQLGSIHYIITSSSSNTTTSSTSTQSSAKDTYPQHPEDAKIETLARSIIPRQINAPSIEVSRALLNFLKLRSLSPQHEIHITDFRAISPSSSTTTSSSSMKSSVISEDRRYPEYAKTAENTSTTSPSSSTQFLPFLPLIAPSILQAHRRKNFTTNNEVEPIIELIQIILRDSLIKSFLHISDGNDINNRDIFIIASIILGTIETYINFITPFLEQNEDVNTTKQLIYTALMQAANKILMEIDEKLIEKETVIFLFEHALEYLIFHVNTEALSISQSEIGLETSDSFQKEKASTDSSICYTPSQRSSRDREPTNQEISNKENSTISDLLKEREESVLNTVKQLRQKLMDHPFIFLLASELKDTPQDLEDAVQSIRSGRMELMDYLLEHRDEQQKKIRGSFEAELKIWHNMLEERFTKLEEINPNAIKLLKFCAYLLNPIPEFLIADILKMPVGTFYNAKNALVTTSFIELKAYGSLIILPRDVQTMVLSNSTSNDEALKELIIAFNQHWETNTKKHTSQLKDLEQKIAVMHKQIFQLYDEEVENKQLSLQLEAKLKQKNEQSSQPQKIIDLYRQAISQLNQSEKKTTPQSSKSIFKFLTQKAENYFYQEEQERKERNRKQRISEIEEKIDKIKIEQSQFVKEVMHTQQTISQIHQNIIDISQFIEKKKKQLSKLKKQKEEAKKNELVRAFWLVFQAMTLLYHCRNINLENKEITDLEEQAQYFKELLKESQNFQWINQKLDEKWKYL